MAAALFTRAAGGAHEARCAGTNPAETIQPGVVAAMEELDIDLSAEVPRLLLPEDAEWADLVVTMGCGDECPFYPGKRYEDWVLDDPAGRPLEAVRPIRDQIKQRVEALVRDLTS